MSLKYRFKQMEITTIAFSKTNWCPLSAVIYTELLQGKLEGLLPTEFQLSLSMSSKLLEKVQNESIS